MMSSIEGEKVTYEAIKLQLTSQNGEPRQDVIVAGEVGYNTNFYSRGFVNLYGSELVARLTKFFVAPSTAIEPDNADALNNFLDGLVNFNPSDRVGFHLIRPPTHNSPYLRLGNAHFNEKLTPARRSIVITFPLDHPLLRNRFSQSSESNEARLEDRYDVWLIHNIQLIPYPNIKLATLISEYEAGYHAVPWDKRTVAYDHNLDQLRAWIHWLELISLKQGKNPYPAIRRV